MLQLCRTAALKWMRLQPTFPATSFRLMSKNAGDSSGKDKCTEKGDANKNACPKKEAKTAEDKSKPDDGAKEKKKEISCDAIQAKKLDSITGGSKCKPKTEEKKAAACPKLKRKPKQLSCQELLLKREGMLKDEDDGELTTIRGGSKRCPCPPKMPSPNTGEHSERWKKISLFGALPFVAILTLLVFSTREEPERLEFRNYSYMFKRSKPYFFKDGLRTAFHNEHFNPLPPVGYEDEIDEGAIGQEPETAEAKKKRQKDFQAVLKDWKKKDSKREAEAKKQQAEAEKEAKKQEAEAAKEAKKQEAEAAKEAKKQEAEAEKERKRQEAEEKKAAKKG